RSRTDDARQGRTWIQELLEQVHTAQTRRPDPAVAQTHGQRQKLPRVLSNGDYRDERRPTAGDQQDPEIRGAAAESCDEEEEEDEFGKMERSREEERQGGVASVCKYGLGANQRAWIRMKGDSHTDSDSK
ncbi:hypothetical protein M9458_049707, partial [Cirrhinus mrigala]